MAAPDIELCREFRSAGQILSQSFVQSIFLLNNLFLKLLKAAILVGKLQ